MAARSVSPGHGLHNAGESGIFKPDPSRLGVYLNDAGKKSCICLSVTKHVRASTKL
jgi:hypothetical protein